MKIEDIIIIVLTIISIAVVLWYFLGDSPTLLESLIILILSVMFVSNIQLIKNSVRLGFIEKNTREGFNRMKCDIDLIKRRLKV